jgi:hypothetical protein
VLITAVHFLQYSEYWVVCVNVCVINFQVIFADFLYEVFFQCVKCSPILCALIMSIVSVMVPQLCHMFSIWLEYPEILLLFLIACICSL